MNKKDNPIQVVSIRETDHRPPGPMSSNDKIFGDGASRKDAHNLQKKLRKYQITLSCLLISGRPYL